jgi:LCP family protein required for cell wall assembly
MRALALVIMALVPLTAAAWALSIAVPTVIEARRAVDEVFVEPADREHFDDALASPPAVPSAIAEATILATPSAEHQLPIPTASPTPAASPTATRPGEPSPTPTPASPTATAYPEWDGDEPVHILLLGVDSRPNEEAPPRSDTIIVVRVDPAGQRVDMFSIPRDLLVTIPYYYDTKINAAYPFGETSDLEGGGPTLVAQTIEYNFGIRIDYFASVNIEGLEKIIDTIGGVIVDVPAMLKDDQYPTNDYRYTRVYFPTGPQRMNGPEAVQYARTRYADSDFRRGERQQQVLLAIREQMLEAGFIGKLPELIAELADTLRTDLSPEQVYSLARFGQELPRENIYSHSLLPYMYPATINEGYFLVGDWESLRWLAQNLPDDPYATNNPVEQAIPTPETEETLEE